MSPRLSPFLRCVLALSEGLLATPATPGEVVAELNELKARLPH